MPVADVYAGVSCFPAELGVDGVRAWRDWTETVSEDVTSIVRFLRPPDLPDVPEPIRGRRLLTIAAACIGTREEGEAAIAPLRELGEPIVDSFDQVPPGASAGSTWTPSNRCRDVATIAHPRAARRGDRGLRRPGRARLGLAAGGVEIRHLGGALGRPDPRAAARSPTSTPTYVMLGIGVPMTPELGVAIEDRLERLDEALEPWAAAGGYFNFAERPCDANSILPAEVCYRLAEVKRDRDPEGTIVAGHPAALEAAV